MAKHRSSVFTVIRERLEKEEKWGEKFYEYDAIIGTYQSLNRAEEVAGSSAQAFRDAGVPDGVYRFSVQINTFYLE